ncbi:MAG: hypothetical protein NTZ16_15670, partial [Verrucomicrobia bacterium]|nr:hypothetical protein [Verrucomicrobiota bacterium]
VNISCRIGNDFDSARLLGPIGMRCRFNLPESAHFLLWPNPFDVMAMTTSNSMSVKPARHNLSARISEVVFVFMMRVNG